VTCTVGTNEWRIENEYPSNGKDKWYYDGTNVYHSLETKNGPGPKNVSSPSTKAANSNPAAGVTITIAPSPGGHPLGNLGANIPWLAFCSGSYLKREGRVLPLPVVDVPGTTDSFAFADKTEIFDDPFGLPKLVELLTSRARYKLSLYDERLYRHPQVMQARLHPESKLDDGVLRFRYAVGASTNFNGWNFPVEFSYLDYRFKKFQADGKSEWELAAAGNGRVNSIHWAGKPDNVFVPGAKQTIIDARFRDPTRLLDAIVFPWTNTTIPLTNDPALRARFAAKSAEAEPDPERTATKP
jgi:hypothetical protein